MTEKASEPIAEKKEKNIPQSATTPKIGGTLQKSKKLSIDTVDEDIQLNNAKPSIFDTVNETKAPIAIQIAEFEMHLANYIQDCKKSNENPGFTMILEASEHHVENNQILFKVNSSASKEMVLLHSKEILDYFVQKLQNPTVRLEIEIDNLNVENKTISQLTPIEKLKYLTDKNSLVQELIQKFNLDIDYS